MGQHVWHRNCIGIVGGEGGSAASQMERRGFFAFSAITLQRQVLHDVPLAKDDAAGVLVGSNPDPGSPRLPLSKFERPGSSIGGLSAGRRAKTASVLKRRRCAG